MGVALKRQSQQVSLNRQLLAVTAESLYLTAGTVLFLLARRSHSGKWDIISISLALYRNVMTKRMNEIVSNGPESPGRQLNVSVDVSVSIVLNFIEELTFDAST